MHKKLAGLLVLGLLLLGTTAWAGEQVDLYCLKLPGCCQITCVTLDLECCGCSMGKSPLVAEFRGCKNEVLGTATFAGDWCCGETTAMLDKPVNSEDVYYIRLIKQDDDVTVTWASVRVYCGDACCGKWKKIFKGDLCWEMIPAPKPVVEQAPPPPPPAEEPPAVEPEPEPRPDFSQFPEPEPEPEPEVIVVPGKG